MNAVLAFEDGSVYRGKAFGATKTAVGEAVFNTAVMGYQEALTDPSNYKNILTMTFVEIGCYGINDEDSESSAVQVAGLVMLKNAKFQAIGDVRKLSMHSSKKIMFQQLAVSTLVR